MPFFPSQVTLLTLFQSSLVCSFHFIENDLVEVIYDISRFVDCYKHNGFLK